MLTNYSNTLQRTVGQRGQMDVILIILGVLGLGAIIIAAYVFTVAARNYVSNDLHVPHTGQGFAPRDKFTVRAPRDRRRHIQVQFPLTINSVRVPRDRREKPERRATT